MTNKGIEHFESMSLEDMLLFFERPEDYIVSEKLDGYNLRISRDISGEYYLSRETKGKRVYALTDNIDPFRHPNIFRRVVQQFVRNGGVTLPPDSEIVVEVLMDGVPNVIPYKKDVVQIVLIHKTFNTGFLYEPKTTITIDVPDLNNVGQLVEKTFNIEFYGKGALTGAAIKPDMEMLEFKKKIELLLGTVIVDALVVQDLYCLPKNRKAHGWSLAETRDNINKAQKLVVEFLPDVLVMKEKLINLLVENTPSQYGPSDGFIEGVVVRHSNRYVNKMFKLVPKDTFIKLKDMMWHDRDTLFFTRQSYLNDGMPKDVYLRILDTFQRTQPIFGDPLIDDTIDQKNAEAIWDYKTELLRKH